MSKQKTKKSLAKRFKVTKTGKVLHRSPNFRHKRGTKSKARIRKIKMEKTLFSTFASKIKKLIKFT
jgi:large subunit ribosomal protein L35